MLHTLTSPSLYLELIGTAAVYDKCTTVGPNVINPIITLAPGELSTWKPPAFDGALPGDNFTVGEVWYGPIQTPDYDDTYGIAPLKIKDLACPTWGLGKTTSANGTVVTTIGPPWLPVIIPPIQMFTLDPTWEAICTGVFNGIFGVTTFGLFDPPIALTPAPRLAPTPPAPIATPADPTTVLERATSYSQTAKPASSPNDPVAPARTGDPRKERPSQSPVMASVNPASSPQNSAASSSKDNGDPPVDPPQGSPLDHPEVPLVSTIAGVAPADSPLNSKTPLVSTIAGDAPADQPSKSKVPIKY